MLEFSKMFESISEDRTKIEELFDEQDRKFMEKFNEIFRASLDIEGMMKRKQDNRKSLTTGNMVNY